MKDLAQSQQEANELGANPSSPASGAASPSSRDAVTAGGYLSSPPRRNLGRNKRAEERLRIMREAIDRG